MDCCPIWCQWCFDGGACFPLIFNCFRWCGWGWGSLRFAIVFTPPQPENAIDKQRESRVLPYAVNLGTIRSLRTRVLPPSTSKSGKTHKGGNAIIAEFDNIHLVDIDQQQIPFQPIYVNLCCGRFQYGTLNEGRISERFTSMLPSLFGTQSVEITSDFW